MVRVENLDLVLEAGHRGERKPRVPERVAQLCFLGRPARPAIVVSEIPEPCSPGRPARRGSRAKTQGNHALVVGTGVAVERVRVGVPSDRSRVTVLFLLLKDLNVTSRADVGRVHVLVVLPRPLHRHPSVLSTSNISQQKYGREWSVCGATSSPVHGVEAQVARVELLEARRGEKRHGRPL